MNNTLLFNTLADTENLSLLGISPKKADTFKRFALDFCSENPVAFKSYMLACEYAFQYEAIKADIEKLTKRNKDLEAQLAEYKKQSEAIILGEWTITKKEKGVEVVYTYEELRYKYIHTMNENEDKIYKLRTRKDLIEVILTSDVVALVEDEEVTSAEKIASVLLRYALLGSKCLDIKKSFVDLGRACQQYNREVLKKATTKETYAEMKNQFSILAELVKVTKDTKGKYLKVKTFSFNAEEMKILADTLFSSASIGIIEADGKAYFNLTSENTIVILDNIVKIIIMKLQGVKITTENI